jgi:hypothetical protein
MNGNCPTTHFRNDAAESRKLASTLMPIGVCVVLGLEYIYFISFQKEKIEMQPIYFGNLRRILIT